MKGFRDFVLRGNLVELAVAFIIGAAFAASSRRSPRSSSRRSARPRAGADFNFDDWAPGRLVDGRAVPHGPRRLPHHGVRRLLLHRQALRARQGEVLPGRARRRHDRPQHRAPPRDPRRAARASPRPEHPAARVSPSAGALLAQPAVVLRLAGASSRGDVRDVLRRGVVLPRSQRSSPSPARVVGATASGASSAPGWSGAAASAAPRAPRLVARRRGPAVPVGRLSHRTAPGGPPPRGSARRRAPGPGRRRSTTPAGGASRAARAARRAAGRGRGWCAWRRTAARPTPRRDEPARVRRVLDGEVDRVGRRPHRLVDDEAVRAQAPGEVGEHDRPCVPPGLAGTASSSSATVRRAAGRRRGPPAA